MAKPSGYVLKQQLMNKTYIDFAEKTMRQFMLDTMMITMHNEFGWGPERLQKLAKAWGKVYSDHYQAVNAENPEADYLREQIDQALRAAYKDVMTVEPFEERYPELKKVTYGRKK